MRIVQRIFSEFRPRGFEDNPFVLVIRPSDVRGCGKPVAVKWRWFDEVIDSEVAGDEEKIQALG